MRRYLTLFLTVVFTAAMLAVAVDQAHALAPTVSVTKERIYTGAVRYTATIDHAADVTATDRDPAYLPSTTGGCHLVYHVNTRNHAKIIDALYCDSVGTVSIRTKPTYTCGVTFALTATDGADSTTYTDALTGPCPPPAPPAVVVAYDGVTLTFTNPATVDQSASYGTTVSDLACTFAGDPAFATQTSTRFAGIAPNRYTYSWAFVQGVVAAGATVSLVKVCP